MGPRSGASRRNRRRARRWPDLLLTLLAPAALALPFLDRGSWWFRACLAAWVIGGPVAAAVFLFPGTAERPHGLADRVRLLLLVLPALHILVAETGAASSPWWPAYGLVVVIAAAGIPGWWTPALCLLAAVVLEGGHAAVAGLSDPALAVWGKDLFRLATGLGLLALLAAAVGWFFWKSRQGREALQSAVDEHRRLQEEAREYRALSESWPEPEGQALSPRQKETGTLSAVVGLDEDYDRVLGLARRAIEARSVLFFILDEGGERLAIRRAVTADAKGEAAAAIDTGIALRVGEGVIGHAAKTHRSALFTNLPPGSLRPGLYRGGAPPPSPSLVVVPVNEHEVFRGMLVADAAAPGAFAREHEHLLEGFAREVGKILENARDGARRERHSHRLKSLRSLSQSISGTIKIEELLPKMVDLARAIVPYEQCALFIADPVSERLVLRAQRGFPESAADVSVSPDHGLVGYIASNRRPLLFSNLRERDRGVEIVPGAPGQERISSFLGVPIPLEEGRVGVWVLTAEEPGRFDAEHLDLLLVVASQAGILISNAFLHEQVERMARTDGLTGLNNHRRFQEQLQHEVERADRTREAVSLLLLDIDHFKKVNDTYGHPFGDRVIKALSTELMKLARRVDFVARYGGEEFAVILVSTDRKGCRTTAQRVLKAVRAIRIPHEGQAFSFTVSVGAATGPDDAKTREDLVRHADQALYAAKEGGRNQVKAYGELVHK